MEKNTQDKGEAFETNPFENANPISALTFTYMFPIFKRAFKTRLTENDLFLPLAEHKSSVITDKVERIWKEEYRIHKKTALHRALFRVFGFTFMLFGLVKLMEELILLTILPYSIGRLVAYFDKSKVQTSKEEAYYYGGAVCFCFLIVCMIGHPSVMGLQHIGMKLRISCCSLIYRKSLRLSQASLGKTTTGQFVNLLSNDASKFDQGFALMHYVWVGPIQTSLGIYLLYREVGNAAFFGMVFLISFIPLQVWLGKRASVLRLRTALRTDERVRLMNEILSGIQVIKMYCWERPFAKLISLARRKEIKAIRAHSYMIGLIYSFEMFVYRVAIYFSILGYVLLGNKVTAEKIFVITTIYGLVKPVITVLFSLSITTMAEINISILRFQEILSCEEHQADQDLEKLEVAKLAANGKDSIPPKENGHANHDLTGAYNLGIAEHKLLLEDVCAKWSKDASEDTLKNINIKLDHNQLLAIIGPVGSGKSSLLNVILKELPVHQGRLRVQGSLSFSSQEPWLFTGTIRQNILFGEFFDEDRYDRVVNVCALRADFASFTYGDLTLVGEKGKSLSGGQKARINLARCIYKRADIYLLDDPLSAVDANVGKHLYNECVRHFLSDKICILVTHQLQYLKSADHIIIMDEGEIQQQGTYKNLQASAQNFAKLLERHHSTDEEAHKKTTRSRQNSEMTDEAVEDEEAPELEKEAQASGSVGFKAYSAYFKAGGPKIAFFTLAILFIGCQAIANAGEYYVTWWVNHEEDLNAHNQTLDHIPILYVYSGITAITVIIAIVKSLYFMYFFTVASINLHDYIFDAIIQAKMKFYNANPSGRILNRFSKDLGTIDEYIPNILIDVVEIALLLLGVIVLATIVSPWLLVPSIIICAVFYGLRLIYIKTSRSVKRIEAITRSPLYSHMTASLNGLTTIRAFKAQSLLAKEFDDLQDRHSSAWFLFIASSRCFGFWLDMFCNVFSGSCIFVLLIIQKDMYGGDLGLVITQCLSLMSFLQWGIRQWSELENQMTSVERVLEYTRLESEPIRPKSNLAIDWPSKGSVEFRQVSLKYTETDPYVLKGLNFSVKPQEKIGIVGRTGAGKSSTISALFQLYDLEGSILIDEVDTTQLPLDEVRTKISIIPQEPVLFSGSMRRNLDPFEEYSDETLWNALEQVELKDTIAELPSGLHTNVTEGGSNFSVGQRQLVCLARALIRNNKVLVLDEATANVDPHTDALIQQTIRDKFSDCSVLTIAHRLHTVMDSDRILVMNAGSVEEFDHPHVLLQKEQGILKKLVQKTGFTMAHTLQEIARLNYEKLKME